MQHAREAIVPFADPKRLLQLPQLICRQRRRVVLWWPLGPLPMSAFLQTFNVRPLRFLGDRQGGLSVARPATDARREVACAATFSAFPCREPRSVEEARLIRLVVGAFPFTFALAFTVAFALTGAFLEPSVFIRSKLRSHRER